VVVDAHQMAMVLALVAAVLVGQLECCCPPLLFLTFSM
jgi:hypothetical protein